MINYEHLKVKLDNPEDIVLGIDSVKQSRDYSAAIKWNACSDFDLLFARKKIGMGNTASSLVDIYIKESEADAFFSDISLVTNFSMYANNEKARFQFGRFYVVTDSAHDALFNFKKDDSEENDNGVVSSDSGMDLLKYVMRQAILINASDIHFYFKYDSSESEYFLRYHGERFPIEPLASKELEILLRDLPTRATGATKQEYHHNSGLDYRAAIQVDNSDILIRYNQTPGADQLSCVLRLAIKPIKKGNAKAKIPTMEELGFPATQIDAIERVAFKNDGGVLATGPTGSGKTTFSRLLIARRLEGRGGSPHVLTAEDPIESNISGTHMTDLNSVTNSSEIIQRANRQDTDYFFLGEIRDNSHAHIFEQVGISGKPLLSTMHIGHPLEAYGKLTSLGCNQNNVMNNEFLTCIVQMNLAQALCPHCSFTLDEAIKLEEEGSLMESIKDGTPFTVAKEVKEFLYQKDNMFSRLGTNTLEFSEGDRPKSKFRIRNPKGCSECRGNIKQIATKSSALVPVGKRGLKGMTLVSETFVPNEKILQTFLTQTIAEVWDYYNTLFRFESDHACSGMPLQEQAFRKLLNGEICANYFQESIMPLGILLDRFIGVELRTKEALINIGVDLKEHGGFSFETHLKNETAILHWREEFAQKSVEYREKQVGLRAEALSHD